MELMEVLSILNVAFGSADIEKMAVIPMPWD
jgi:hypothetical protein